MPDVATNRSVITGGLAPRAAFGLHAVRRNFARFEEAL